jgi:hypothetical protein
MSQVVWFIDIKERESASLLNCQGCCLMADSLKLFGHLLHVFFANIFHQYDQTRSDLKMISFASFGLVN